MIGQTVDVLTDLAGDGAALEFAQCLDPNGARLTIQRILAKAGLDGTVRLSGPFPPERPCASPGFDEQIHAVVLTGVPTADIGG